MTGAPAPPMDHRPPEIPGKGCVRALGLGCGLFLALVLAGLAVLYWKAGWVVTVLETGFIRGVLDRAEADFETRTAVNDVLKAYDEERERADLGFGGFRTSLNAFSRSPAAMVLGAWDARASLKRLKTLPAGEAQRAQAVFDRLARAAAEEKIAADDLAGLIRRARQLPEEAAGDVRPVDVAELSADDLKRFLPEAERLLAERNVPEGPYEPDIVALIRRDLWASLEAGRRRE